MEIWGEAIQKITEFRIRKIHAILYSKRNAKPTSYRDGQNVIRASDGTIVYMPPEAEDVPKLMTELVKWIHSSSSEIAIPIISGIAHYQFETIHPFYDGNGRTGRLLTTWILYQAGYDLGKYYSLEEFYANDLTGYYEALNTHPYHNYYFGRHEADLTSWLEYFLNVMQLVFEQVADEVKKSSPEQNINKQKINLLKPLDYRARRVIGLFTYQDTIRSSDVANLLGLSTRQARELLSGWVVQGWIEIMDHSRRGRKYSLSDEYKKTIIDE
ncbi:MAG: Fic family protein [Chloroflexota bacterium]